MKTIIALLILSGISLNAQSYLSNLQADKDDPIYTSYAAPMSRSEYKIDQAYHLSWYNPNEGVGFTSAKGGSIGLAFNNEQGLRYKLEHYYKEPVITASYSDIVKLHYYPYKGVRVNVTFDVYSSRLAIHDIEIVNESMRDIELNLLPYFTYDADVMKNLKYDEPNNSFTFNHTYKRDGWMLNHDIPIVEERQNVYMISEPADNRGTYEQYTVKQRDKSDTFLHAAEIDSLNNMIDDNPHVAAFVKHINLKAGEKYDLRVIRGISGAETPIAELTDECKRLMGVNLETVIGEDEKLYSQIPEAEFGNEEYEMLYWSAFSLIRQCMMPPEGEAGYNYYVFSREPKWGWGYGGQVFHESLVMFAYALMDPESAMNSQRIYMERQWESGYINYRTGPYLNESIEHKGEYTSSAPWYNYQNLEVYKLTKDEEFLEEAYASGKKFYNYYVSNRDKDNDGLCEWGAHAVLECVRDARVAVWDKVDWPSNFEAVDLNSMLVKEAKSLAEMADILGYGEEKEKWLKDAGARTALIQKTFWDEETDFFYQVDMDDHDFTYETENDLKIKEIIGFLPMWAGAATDEQAEKLMKSMKNTDEFWRRFGIPTLSAKDDYYNPIGYWNGPIWVQWQYMMMEGLTNYGYDEDAVELVDKVSDNIINQLKVDHYFWEFYSADDYQAGWNKTYIWTGIIARMLLEAKQIGNL